MRRYIKYIIAIVLVVTFTAIYITLGSNKSIKHNHTDDILNYMFELRIEHPYIVYAQAVIESNNFQSKIYRENNNMFGMKMPERRATLAIGINKGHAVYRDWRECIIDYALFQMSYKKGLTEEQYLQSLKGYASDTTYIHKVRLLKEKIIKERYE